MLLPGTLPSSSPRLTRGNARVHQLTITPSRALTIIHDHPRAYHAVQHLLNHANQLAHYEISYHLDALGKLPATIIIDGSFWCEHSHRRDKPRALASIDVSNIIRIATIGLPAEKTEGPREPCIFLHASGYKSFTLRHTGASLDAGMMPATINGDQRRQQPLCKHGYI